MLPSLVADLGGRWLLSEELSEEELEGGDVLLVIQPTEPWPEDRLGRVEEYVRGGGSLLVVANPMVEAELAGERRGQTAGADSDQQAVLGHGIRPANRLLEPTGMAFRHDTALAATTSWRGALRGSTHPAVFGLSDRLLGLSLRNSCSIEMSWRARAMLVGRWGWSEPGSRGYAAREAGEKWGDLVLAVFNYGTAAGVWSWRVPGNLLPTHARVEALGDGGTCSLKDDLLQVDLDAFTGTVFRLAGDTGKD